VLLSAQPLASYRRCFAWDADTGVAPILKHSIPPHSAAYSDRIRINCAEFPASTDGRRRSDTVREMRTQAPIRPKLNDWNRW
jgi:hypothetical protein